MRPLPVPTTAPTRSRSTRPRSRSVREEAGGRSRPPRKWVDRRGRRRTEEAPSLLRAWPASTLYGGEWRWVMIEFASVPSTAMALSRRTTTKTNTTTASKYDTGYMGRPR